MTRNPQSLGVTLRNPQSLDVTLHYVDTTDRFYITKKLLLFYLILKVTQNYKTVNIIIYYW